MIFFFHTSLKSTHQSVCNLNEWLDYAHSLGPISLERLIVDLKKLISPDGSSESRRKAIKGIDELFYRYSKIVEPNAKKEVDGPRNR